MAAAHALDSRLQLADRFVACEHSGTLKVSGADGAPVERLWRFGTREVKL